MMPASSVLTFIKLVIHSPVVDISGMLRCYTCWMPVWQLSREH